MVGRRDRARGRGLRCGAGGRDGRVSGDDECGVASGAWQTRRVKWKFGRCMGLPLRH